MMDRIDPQLLEAARDMKSRGASADEIVAYLQGRGVGKLDSIKILALSQGIRLGEAKEIVHFSDAWKDRRRADEEFHANLEDGLKDG